jgi:riboflavin synthase
MFTGLIQRVGTLAERKTRGDGLSFVIRHDPWDSPLELGESVAVQGACLTVTARTQGQFTCDVLGETLAKTHLGKKDVGALLNLERALRLDERLGGHLVTGHVDGQGRVAGIDRKGNDWVLEVRATAELLGGMVSKGSVAVDGVSLTIAALQPSSFTVHLIPHTWDHTSLRGLKTGDPVNLENDLIGKYVARHLERLQPSGGVTLERLRAAGYPA